MKVPLTQAGAGSAIPPIDPKWLHMAAAQMEQDRPRSLRGLPQFVGEVVPFKIPMNIADQRRMMNEQFVSSASDRLGRSKDDIRWALEKIAPSSVVLGPGASR